jgi:hypothetical protein
MAHLPKVSDDKVAPDLDAIIIGQVSVGCTCSTHVSKAWTCWIERLASISI